jgi:cholesterol oxidase
MRDFDCDWLVIGSGFGGSVSALRLSEKGYKVKVLECGRRFRDADFARSMWNVRRYLWAPAVGMHGILRMTPFKDVFILSGSGVGGGSLVYANTMYRALPEFFANPQWATLDDWQTALTPHYETAERMLGVAPVRCGGETERFSRELAEHLGPKAHFKNVQAAVFFGPSGKTVPDPYFGGEGPERTGCKLCGACMMGCRHGAKNTLVKNYLWFAEKNGVEVTADRTVTDVRPIGAADGSDGYIVRSERTGAWLGKDVREIRTRGVIFSAGALGTNRLLARCKLNGSLPRISDRLGELVRTNSESVLAVTLPDDSIDPSRSIAITSSVYPNERTHIEFVTYGRDADAFSLNFTVMVGMGTRLGRPFKAIGRMISHPRQLLRILWPFKWARRTIISVAMQPLDNAIRFKRRRSLFGGVRLSTDQDKDKPTQSCIPENVEAVEWLAKKTGGTPQGMITDSFFNTPTTAHILGGAVIGRDAQSGVVDRTHRVFGYENMLICDGSAMPANPGVNPSLTITAMCELAMSRIGPAADILRV